MIKLLSILLAFLSVNVTSHSIEEEKFIENVHNCYDEYKVITDEVTSVGDITIVIGVKDDDYYISAFFLNNTSVNMNLQVYLNEKLESTFVVEGTVINAFGVKIDETDDVIVVIHHESQDIKYPFKVSEVIADKDSFVIGLGDADFPKNKLETNIINIIRLFIFGFAAVSCCFIFVIIYFYKKRKGRFNSSYKEPIDVVGEYYQEYGDPEVDSKQEVEQINKQALMDRYFEEYRSGDITEEELNEKLKRLWWQDDKN